MQCVYDLVMTSDRGLVLLKYSHTTFSTHKLSSVSLLYSASEVPPVRHIFVLMEILAKLDSKLFNNNLFNSCAYYQAFFFLKFLTDVRFFFK